MKLFDTLKNIWKIEELKTRILIENPDSDNTRVDSRLQTWNRGGTTGYRPCRISRFKTADFEWCAGIAGYVFGRCIFECFDLCLGNYALYLCFYRSSVTGNCGSLFSAYAA